MGVLWWVRRDLRVHDNAALCTAKACSSPGWLLPVFVLDPDSVSHDAASLNKLRFLHDSLVSLDASLRQLGSRLFVVRGPPEASR